MPTKKKVELPEEMTTPLEAQESQTEENITASVILRSPRLKQIRRKRMTLRPEFRTELSTNRRNPRPR